MRPRLGRLDRDDRTFDRIGNVAHDVNGGKAQHKLPATIGHHFDDGQLLGPGPSATQEPAEERFTHAPAADDHEPGGHGRRLNEWRPEEPGGFPVLPRTGGRPPCALGPQRNVNDLGIKSNEKI